MIDAQAFARTWAEAWNAHDLEAALALFADDILFTSPLAAKLVPESGGVVRGKKALRDYWSAGLAKAPQLHFEINWVMAGVDLIVIGFRNEQSVDRCEVLRFRDGLVIEGHGTYPAA
jgi:hypothetical protein